MTKILKYAEVTAVTEVTEVTAVSPGPQAPGHRGLGGGRRRSSRDPEPHLEHHLLLPGEQVQELVSNM